MTTTDKTRNEDDTTPVTTEGEKDNYIRLHKLLFYCMLSGLLIIVISILYLQYRQHLLNGQFNSFITSQNDLNKKFSSKQDLNNLKTDLNNSIRELTQNNNYSNQDWALAEAEYLMILALHRLTLEKDVKTALVAMQEAESRLHNIEDPALFPVTEQLAKDINRLKSVNVVDISALAVFLADMINHVEQLPLNDLNDIQTIDKSAGLSRQDSQTEEKGIVMKFLEEIWKTFKSLLIIRHKDEIKQAVILPGQEIYLYQNLRLELETARLSVLRGDTDNLDISINIIIEWLKSYFDMNDSSVVNLVDTLQKMSQQDLTPELPDINSSLESLRAYIRSSGN